MKKKFAKIEAGVVIRTQRDMESGLVECPESVVCGQLFDGNTYSNPPPPPPKTPEEILTEKQAAIEERINSDELLSMLIDDAAQLKGMTRAAYVANLKGRVQA